MSEPFGRLRRFLRELKRRNVYKVAATYAVVAFVTLQAARLIFPATTLQGAYDVLVLVAFVGFPLAIVLAWAFEATPEGVRRTPEATGEAAGSTAYQWVGLALVLVLAGGVWYVTTGEGESPLARKATATHTTQGEPSPAPRLGRRSIAVLPFDNLSSTEEAQPFVNGIHDDLLTRLSNVSELKVISRTSVMPYRETELSLRAIADSLGVRWVVEGGVQHADNRVQVNAQLINAQADVHQWAKSYQRKLTTDNVFAIQSELTKEIARSLEAQLTPAEQERVERQPTEDLDAYKLYVLGKRLLGERTGASIRGAMEHFRRALEQDSSYALAWAGLAEAQVLYPDYAADSALDSEFEVAMRAGIANAKESARQALKYDSDLAEAHASLAVAYLSEQFVEPQVGNGPQALRRLQRAVELKPSYGQAQAWLGTLYLLLGRPKRGLEHLELAVQLNPARWSIVRSHVRGLLANGRYEEALAQSRRLLEINPKQGGGHIWRLHALAHVQNWQAIQDDSFLSANSDEPWVHSWLASAAAGRGDTASARRHLTELKKSDLPLSFVGFAHADLGERKAALSAYHEADFDYASSVPAVLNLRYFYPEGLGPLRDEPRFQELIRHINTAWGLNPDGSLPDSVDVSFGAESAD